MKVLAVLALLAAVGCHSGPPQPVDIDASDMCSRCRMAISQKRYAAELFDRDGNVFKFDDIGCLLHYAIQRHLNLKDHTVFVMDYGTERWLGAGRAVYVRSGAIPSPMSGGLAAFADRPRAEEFASTVQGRVLAFEELWIGPS